MALQIETPPEKWAAFTEEYLRVRDAEGRFFSDNEVRMLPVLPVHHPLKTEFDERAKTLHLLTTFLPQNGNILDLGCGNGWMSHQLAKAGHTVLGVDVNLPELEQAARVFTAKNVGFAFADVFEWQPKKPFETVIISSALQYFPSPKILFNRIFAICPTAQKIIICDTPFYETQDVPSAAARTKKYYASRQSQKMAEHYFHHSLKNMGHKWHYLYKPYVSILRRIFGGPQFPIIAIYKNI